MTLLLKIWRGEGSGTFYRQSSKNCNGSTNLGEMMKEQNTMEIDVFQLFKTLWKRKLMILLVALVTGAGAFAYGAYC